MKMSNLHSRHICDFSKAGLTHGLSWKIEIWRLFSSPDCFWVRGDVCKQAKPMV